MKQIFKFSRHRYPITNNKSYPLIFYYQKNSFFMTSIILKTGYTIFSNNKQYKKWLQLKSSSALL